MTAPRDGSFGSRIPRAALGWAFVLNLAQRGGAAVVTLVIAAIVGPREYGLVVMAMVYVTLVKVCLEQGIAIALVQREDLEDEDLDAAFWMNLAWAALLTVASLALADLWARANGESDLTLVIRVLTLIIPIQALAIVQSAVLQRRLRFKALAARSGVAALVSGGVGIGLALAGAGVWALVGQLISFELASLAMLWKQSGWTPRLRFSTAHARRIVGFSGHVFLGNLAVWFGRRIDALLMGVFFGPVAVGLYRLADRLVETIVAMTAQPVQAVSIPFLARLQNAPAELREAVRRMFRVAVLLTVPAMLVLAATSDQVIAVFGPEWEPAADCLKLLAIVGIGRAFLVFVTPLMYALGKPNARAALLWGLALVSAATFVPVAAVLRSSDVRDQIVGIAASRAAVFVIVFVPLTLWLAARLADIELKRLLSPLAVPLAAGLVAVLAVSGLAWTGLLAQSRPVVEAGLAAGVAALSVAVVLLWLEQDVRRAALVAFRRVRGQPRADVRGGPAASPDGN